MFCPAPNASTTIVHFPAGHRIAVGERARSSLRFSVPATMLESMSSALLPLIARVRTRAGARHGEADRDATPRRTADEPRAVHLELPHDEHLSQGGVEVARDARRDAARIELAIGIEQDRLLERTDRRVGLAGGAEREPEQLFGAGALGGRSDAGAARRVPGRSPWGNPVPRRPGWPAQRGVLHRCLRGDGRGAEQGEQAESGWCASRASSFGNQREPFA